MEELSQYNLTNSYTSISKNFEEMINNAISVYDADKIGKMGELNFFFILHLQFKILRNFFNSF